MVSAAAKRPSTPDPTHYPVEDDVGEGIVHRLVADLLRALVERWLAQRGKPTFVGASQFVYWVQHEPTRSVAPDVYVLPGVAPGTDVKTWKVWETGVVPSFALEVVSSDVDKDYEHGPRRYDELGVRELVVFDPEYDLDPPARGSRNERCRWQVFRRVPRRGFVLVLRTNADRVRSKVLGAWLRVVGDGSALRVRLATDARGDLLLPTEAEAERAAKEAERAAKEAERAAREAERAGREAAEAEVAKLRAELEALRRR